MPRNEKAIYLTFDDGPIPELTPWVLDTLKDFNARATFFCVGDNIRKHPDIFERILQEGHAIGNHTFNHLNGWKTENTEYLKNVLLADEQIRAYTNSDLFRPPYGRITLRQMQQFRHKRIVMWDVLSGDFSAKLSPEKVLAKTIQNTRPGAVVVFHDNLKAERNLKFALPAYLSYLTENGFSLKAL